MVVPPPFVSEKERHQNGSEGVNEAIWIGKGNVAMLLAMDRHVLSAENERRVAAEACAGGVVVAGAGGVDDPCDKRVGCCGCWDRREVPSWTLAYAKQTDVQTGAHAEAHRQAKDESVP